MISINTTFLKTQQKLTKTEDFSKYSRKKSRNSNFPANSLPFSCQKNVQKTSLDYTIGDHKIVGRSNVLVCPYSVLLCLSLNMDGTGFLACFLFHSAWVRVTFVRGVKRGYHLPLNLRHDCC